MEFTLPIEKSSSRTEKWILNHFNDGGHLFDITSEFNAHKLIIHHPEPDISSFKNENHKGTSSVSLPHENGPKGKVVSSSRHKKICTEANINMYSNLDYRDKFLVSTQAFIVSSTKLIPSHHPTYSKYGTIPEKYMTNDKALNGNGSYLIDKASPFCRNIEKSDLHLSVTVISSVMPLKVSHKLDYNHAKGPSKLTTSDMPQYNNVPTFPSIMPFWPITSSTKLMNQKSKRSTIQSSVNYTYSRTNDNGISKNINENYYKYPIEQGIKNFGATPNLEPNSILSHPSFAYWCWVRQAQIQAQMQLQMQMFTHPLNTLNPNKLKAGPYPFLPVLHKHLSNTKYHKQNYNCDVTWCVLNNIQPSSLPLNSKHENIVENYVEEPHKIAPEDMGSNSDMFKQYSSSYAFWNPKKKSFAPNNILNHKNLSGNSPIISKAATSNNNESLNSKRIDKHFQNPHPYISTSTYGLQDKDGERTREPTNPEESPKARALPKTAPLEVSCCPKRPKSAAITRLEGSDQGPLGIPVSLKRVSSNTTSQGPFKACESISVSVASSTYPPGHKDLPSHFATTFTHSLPSTTPTTQYNKISIPPLAAPKMEEKLGNIGHKDTSAHHGERYSVGDAFPFHHPFYQALHAKDGSGPYDGWYEALRNQYASAMASTMMFPVATDTTASPSYHMPPPDSQERSLALQSLAHHQWPLPMTMENILDTQQPRAPNGAGSSPGPGDLPSPLPLAHNPYMTGPSAFNPFAAQPPYSTVGGMVPPYFSLWPAPASAAHYHASAVPSSPSDALEAAHYNFQLQIQMQHQQQQHQQYYAAAAAYYYQAAFAQANVHAHTGLANPNAPMPGTPKTSLRPSPPTTALTPLSVGKRESGDDGRSSSVIKKLKSHSSGHNGKKGFVTTPLSLNNGHENFGNVSAVDNLDNGHERHQRAQGHSSRLHTNYDDDSIDHFETIEAAGIVVAAAESTTSSPPSIPTGLMTLPPFHAGKNLTSNVAAKNALILGSLISTPDLITDTGIMGESHRPALDVKSKIWRHFSQTPIPSSLNESPTHCTPPRPTTTEKDKVAYVKQQQFNLNHILENLKTHQQQQQHQLGHSNGNLNLSPDLIISVPDTRSSAGILAAARNEKYVCPTCSKVFQKQSQLTLHLNVHYFERPFRCESCTLTFRNKGHLNKHKCGGLKGLGIVPAAAVECHEATRIAGGGKNSDPFNPAQPGPDVSAHRSTPSSSQPIASHHNAAQNDPRPFKCDDCQVAFRIQGHLAKHLRSKMHITGLEKNGKVPCGTYAFFDQRASLNDIDTTSCTASLGSLHRLLQQNNCVETELNVIVSQPMTREPPTSSPQKSLGNASPHPTTANLSSAVSYTLSPPVSLALKIRPIGHPPINAGAGDSGGSEDQSNDASSLPEHVEPATVVSQTHNLEILCSATKYRKKINV